MVTMHFDSTRSNQQMLEEAAEWLVNQREGLIDAAGQQAFTAWLRRSPEHIQAYLEVAAVWTDVGSMASKEDIDIAELVAFGRSDDNVVPLGTGGTSPSINDAPADARRVVATQEQPEFTAAPRTLRTLRSRWLPIAACVVLVGVATGIWREVHQGLYSTDIGEQRSIALPDGSTIALNARSAVRVRYDKQLRRVELLSGQCLFKVAPSSTRPFVVTSGDLGVRALGTQFDIDLRRSGATVTVVEGKVAVSPISRATSPAAGNIPLTTIADHRTPSSEDLPSDVLVAAGQQVVVQPEAQISAAQPRPADTTSVTAWTQRQVVFESTSLADVIDEFNRYNTRQIVIADPRIETLRVSGVFSLSEQGLLLRFLREQVGLHVNEASDSIHISKK